ncbi:MAG: phosphatase PAP2 family protein [Candidatus Aenigmatarchaeota archaeon]
MDFWYLVTNIGEPQIWAASTAILLLAYFIFRKKLSSEKRKLFRKVLYIYIPGVLISLLVVLIMKNLIIIERPCIPCVVASNCNPYCDIDNSFPSGHTTAMFAVVTSLYLALRRKQLLPLYALALLVAASRYFLGVHWPADLIGGAVLGITIPVIFWIVYKKEYEPRGG